MRTIVIAGGSGFLGQVVARHFETRGWKVVVLTRRPPKPGSLGQAVIWDGRNAGAWQAECEAADALLNLAGASVNCRYHRRNRERILRSRIESTEILRQTVANAARPPKVWVNASSATIYRHSEIDPMTEETGELGTGFSVDVCRSWESAFFAGELPATRRVALRSSLVLGVGKNSVYPTLARIARFGMGGKLGHGNQMVSWIHEDDFARAVAFAIEDETLAGVLNVTAPAPVTNRVFMKTLRESIGVPVGLPHFRPLLEAAAFLMRTETELILKSRFAYPARLLERRFVFKYPFLDEALAALSNGNAKDHRVCHWNPTHAETDAPPPR